MSENMDNVDNFMDKSSTNNSRTTLEGGWYKHTEVYAPDGSTWRENYEALLNTLVEAVVVNIHD